MNLRRILLLLLIVLILSVALRCSIKLHINTRIYETFIGDAIPLPHNLDDDTLVGSSSSINKKTLKVNENEQGDIGIRFRNRNIFNTTLTKRNETIKVFKPKPIVKPLENKKPKLTCPPAPKPIDINGINNAFNSGLLEFEDQMDDLDEEIIKKMQIIEQYNSQILLLQNQLRDQELARQEAQNIQDRQDKMMLEVSGEQNRTLVGTYKKDLTKSYKELNKLRKDNKQLVTDNNKLRQGVCVKQKKKKKKI
jgi:hypothetical protein